MYLKFSLPWYGMYTTQVEEGTPLFVSLPDTNNDTVADELCLASRHQQPFASSPTAPLTLNYYLCSADDVRMVSHTSFYFIIVHQITLY